MCSSVLPEMKKWLAAGAKSCNLGESSTSLELVTRERIESVSKHFFTEIWGLGLRRRGFLKRLKRRRKMQQKNVKRTNKSLCLKL